jgi:integrase/recombinase XerC
MKSMEYFEKYMNTENMSQNTILAYMSDVRKMLESIGKQEAEITYIDLIEWKGDIQSLASATVDRKIRAVRKYFEFLFNAEFIEKNPAEKLTGVKVKNKEMKALTSEQLNAMLNNSWGRDRAIIMTLATTAIRVSELINLQYEDLGKEEITIVGKGDKARKIYLNEATRKAIKDYLPRRKAGCSNLFISDNNTPMKEKNINAMLKKVAKRTGMFEDASWVTPHTLRRTRATLWSEAGVPLATIQKSMGHSRIETTMKYIKVYDDSVQNAMMMEV